MTPFIFTKTLFEARIGLDDDSNREYVLDDEGNLAEEDNFADTDDEELQGLSLVDPDDTHDADESDEAGAPATRSRRSARTTADSAKVAEDDNSAKSFAMALERDTRKLCTNLANKLRPIFERYRGDVLPDVDNSLSEKFAEVYPSAGYAQQLLNEMERMGIAMRENGIPVPTDGLENDRPVTPGDLTSLYMLTLPVSTLRAQYTGNASGEIRLPDMANFGRKAIQVNDNIMGHGNRTEAVVPHVGSKPFCKSVMTVTKKSPSKNTGAGIYSDTTSTAVVTYDGPNVPDGTAISYAIVDRAFQYICSTIKKNAPLMAIINGDNSSDKQVDVAIKNMAAERMFLGEPKFKEKYGVLHKSPGRNMRYPMYASWDANNFTASSSFIESLFAFVINPATPDGVHEPDKIYRPDGTQLSEEDVKAFADAFSGGKVKNKMITIPMASVRKYITGNYSVGYNKEPVFSFFHASGTTFRTDSTGSADDDAVNANAIEKEVSEGHASAADDASSINAGIVAADARLTGKTDAILSIYKRLFGSKVSTEQDDESMKGICAEILEEISNSMQDIGARSYIKRDGDSISIHVDPSEAKTDDENIASIWRRIYTQYRSAHGAATAESPLGYRKLEKISRIGIFQPVEVMLQWFGSFDSAGTADISRYTSRIMNASPADVRALTPSVKMDALMNEHILKNDGDVLVGGVPGIFIGGKAITGQDVIKCAYTYINQICRACGYELATPKAFKDTIEYLLNRYAYDLDDMLTAAVSAAGDSYSLDGEFSNEYEQVFLQFIMSRIPDANSPELIPPTPLGEGESVDDYDETMLIDMNPQKLAGWFTRVYNNRDNRLRTLRVCYGMAMVLANMCGRDKNKLSNTADTLNTRELDNIDAAVHLNIPINQLHARSYTAIMAVIAHYAGDSGASMQTLLKFINHPDDAPVDEEEAGAIVDAANKLGELDFLSFPVFEKKDFSSQGIDETQVILDEIAAGKKSILNSSKVDDDQ